MDAMKYIAQPWDCKDFDEDECQRQIAENLQEQYNTIYDCVFVPPEAAGGLEGLLLTSHHTGEVRLYNWRQVCSKWLNQRTQQQHMFSWTAHGAAVYSMTLLQYNAAYVLVTAGSDGKVRLWQLSDILAAAADAADESCQLQAAAEVLLPHLQNPLGISDGAQPTAQALAADEQHQQVFVGGSDGGVHAWQLSQLASAAAISRSSDAPAATTAAVLSLRAMPGHAAAVLDLDCCSATQQLASASEDGTVRVWDCSTLQCLSILHPHPVPLRDDPGSVIPLDQPSLLLKCARSPANSCVRFDAQGNWLLIGNTEGYLVLWSTRLGTSAAHTRCMKHKDSSDPGDVVVPQVLLVTASTIYVAGTDKQLHQFSFQLQHVHSLDVSAESVFGAAHQPSSGMLAVCGSRCSLDLLSSQGISLGHVKPPASVFVPAP